MVRGRKVPVENRVGEENKGWTYAKYLLGHERSGIAGVGPLQARAKRLKEMRASNSPAASPSSGPGIRATAL